jgi:hypothetical protein
VVANRGHGSHLVNDDVAAGNITCPICATVFPMEHICIYQCDAKMTTHDHQEETHQFFARGREIVKIGSRDAAMPDGVVVTIETKDVRSSCAVM